MYASDSNDEEEERVLPILRETAQVIIRRLHTLGRATTKGKTPERQVPDEAWDCMTRLADMLKQNPFLSRHVDIVEALHAALPFLADSATIRQRTAGYRLLRYLASRRSWGRMMSLGVEYLIIR
jgi:hypothetical protein